MSKSTLKKKESSSSRDLSSKSQSPAKEVSSPGSGGSRNLSGDLWKNWAPIWPEWSETEVNAEKWDSAKGAKDSKARKSPLAQFFDDPDGKVKMPASLNVHTWKRPSEHMANTVLVVVENDSTLDLMSANEHLLCSELVRRIISEIYIVWRACDNQSVDENGICEKVWRPWDHIYSLCKATKDHVPLYNNFGKYLVRLFWMGCWRKITVDDLLPFDEQNNMQLPATINQSELWPMLLTKALLKLANTEVVRDSSRELEEFSIVHCLTGWIPEHIPLKDCPLVADSKKPPAPYSKLIRTSSESTITDEPKKSEEIEGYDPVCHDVTNDQHNLPDAKDIEVSTEEQKEDDGDANVLSDPDLVPETDTMSVQEKLQETWIHAQDFSKCFQRHVLRINTRVQFGLHVQLYSNTEFVFGDEEAVMPHLEKESLQFCEKALSILRALGETVKSFSNPEKLPSALRTLEEVVCPRSLSKPAVGEHWKAFSHAVYQMFCQVLERTLTSDELFAVQGLTRELITHVSDTKYTADVPDSWTGGRQATERETHAATILQAGWKGYLVRKLLTAARPGSKQNRSVAKTLLKMWTSVESNTEKHALSLLRFMFTNNKHLKYPCGGDEWTKITFTDYSVPVHETTSSWILLFREVFYIPKAMLLVPRICSPFLCQLHVTNNDTWEEVPKFFNSVPPFTYTPNKAGYTFVAYTEETAVVGGTWRLRLISSGQHLAKLARQEPASNFVVKEFKDYYLPNKKNVICRHALSILGDVCITVQFQASKEQVCIKLSILDNEKELISKTGQGHVVIPVYCLSANEGSCGGAIEKAGVGQSQDGPGGGQNGVSDCQPAQTVSIKSYRLILLIAVTDDFKHLIEEPPVVQPVTPKKQSRAAKAKEKDKPAPKADSRTEPTIEQALDESKPHWILRVVTEKPDLERIEVKKDTERLEQIKAMKLAWEAAEPGRAVKAFHTREQYLKKLSMPGKVQTLELEPFIRRTDRPERLKDAVMEEEQQRERLEKIQSFRLYRETVVERRRQEQEQTRELIKEQRQLFDRIQEVKAEMIRSFEQNGKLLRAWICGVQP
ncbi:Androglobin [Bagarius yarrelli]|uniref:Androglobin n=1 Tax=Bagarius yarrelli TaxID=175774 RepID=A0A556TZL6_BAGYA|nr:Androglobin [Bagarius yarrelli]